MVNGFCKNASTLREGNSRLNSIPLTSKAVIIIIIGTSGLTARIIPSGSFTGIVSHFQVLFIVIDRL